MNYFKSITQPKPFIFVLMPFDPKFDDIYEYGIKGAANDVDAYAERVDEQYFLEGIYDRILNQINKADVIVADMTGQNPNVFYEVGYAHALGKIVLLLTQDSNHIPFDLKHRPHTIYNGKINELRKQLAPKIKWALSENDTMIREMNVGLRVCGTFVKSGLNRTQPTTITINSNCNKFFLPIAIQNNSSNTIDPGHQIEIFLKKDSLIYPSELARELGFENKETSLMSLSSFEKLIQYIDGENSDKIIDKTPNDGFQHIMDVVEMYKTDEEIGHGLELQYPLSLSTDNLRGLKGILPQARYLSYIRMVVRCNMEPKSIIKATFNFRVHLANRYYDFLFNLNIIVND